MLWFHAAVVWFVVLISAWQRLGELTVWRLPGNGIWLEGDDDDDDLVIVRCIYIIAI